MILKQHKGHEKIGVAWKPIRHASPKNKKKNYVQRHVPGKSPTLTHLSFRWTLPLIYFRFHSVRTAQLIGIMFWNNGKSAEIRTSFTYLNNFSVAAPIGTGSMANTQVF
jgi:ethanolamine utilization microcompartment shell protein EutS